MNQKMITIKTTNEISFERFLEIFSDSETKELLEVFFQKEDNANQIDVIATKLKDSFQGELPEDLMILPGEAVDEKVKVYVKYRLQMSILANSINRIINEKSVDDLVQIEIKKQLEKANVFEDLEYLIKSIESRKELRKLIDLLS